MTPDSNAEKNEFLTDDPQVILGTEDIAKAPWINHDNLIPANFPGSKNSKKYLLKDDSETVIRISGHRIFPTDLQREMPLHQEGLVQLNRLRDQFNLCIPRCDFVVVNPYIFDPYLMGYKDPSIRDAEFYALDPITKLQVAPSVGLDVYVKTEFVHGQALNDMQTFSPELLFELDQLIGNLIWYFTQGYLANPGQKFPALNDIVTANQYMWGRTASNPDTEHLYLVDLELNATKLDSDNFYDGIIEIPYLYWNFLRDMEQKTEHKLAHARQQLEHALSLIGHRDPESAEEIRRAISLKNADEFEDEYNY
jgi:hypothetical protein